MDDRTGTPRDDLEAILEESRALGFLGPGPLAPHIDHARGFASMVERAPESFLDLGSGGGLPGLVLVREWVDARAVLLDASARRTEFLRRACAALGVDDRVEVVCDRAEHAARDPRWRGAFGIVTARSFGAPAVTAECAVGFLARGGRLVVSEPPTDEPDRWPVAGVTELGLALVRRTTAKRRFVVLERSGELDARFPRRTGIPAKRPIWR